MGYLLYLVVSGDIICLGLCLVAVGAVVGARHHNLGRLADGAPQARSNPKGPAVVLVELGANDLLDGTTPAKFGTDVRSFLQMVKTRHRRILMFELPLLPFQNAFGRIQREACKEYGVTLVPRSVLAGALTLPGHATDGLHLSAQGHAWLAARVSEMWLRA